MDTLTVDAPVSLWPIDGVDEGLVEAARSGDRRALEALLRASWDMALPVCHRVTGHPADAADAAQETLIAVARNLGRFDGRSRYSTWLYRIAVNCGIDEVRRRRRRPEPATPDLADIQEPAPADLDDSVSRTVDVDAALMRLPLDFRAAVVLRDLCGLDYDEIGETLAIPPGTVRSRIARGRARLAEMFVGQGTGETPAEDLP